jgi:hypothetical protein
MERLLRQLAPVLVKRLAKVAIVEPNDLNRKYYELTNKKVKYDEESS